MNPREPNDTWGGDVIQSTPTQVVYNLYPSDPARPTTQELLEIQHRREMEKLRGIDIRVEQQRIREKRSTLSSAMRKLVMKQKPLINKEN